MTRRRDIYLSSPELCISPTAFTQRDISDRQRSQRDIVARASPTSSINKQQHHHQQAPLTLPYPLPALAVLGPPPYLAAKPLFFCRDWVRKSASKRRSNVVIVSVTQKKAPRRSQGVSSNLPIQPNDSLPTFAQEKQLRPTTNTMASKAQLDAPEEPQSDGSKLKTFIGILKK